MTVGFVTEDEWAFMRRTTIALTENEYACRICGARISMGITHVRWHIATGEAPVGVGPGERDSERGDEQ